MGIGAVKEVLTNASWRTNNGAPGPPKPPNLNPATPLHASGNTALPKVRMSSKIANTILGFLIIILVYWAPIPYSNY